MSMYKNTLKDAVAGKPEGFRFAFGDYVFEIKNGEPVPVLDERVDARFLTCKIGVLNTVMKDEKGSMIIDGENYRCLSREYVLH